MARVPRVRAGSVVVIPIGPRSVLAKVLYVSRYFRNVIQLAVYDLHESRLDALPATSPMLYVYTAQQCVRPGGWYEVGSLAVTEPERLMSRRIVADDVWLADELLGVASAEDRRRLPGMNVEGCALVETTIRSHLGL